MQVYARRAEQKRAKEALKQKENVDNAYSFDIPHSLISYFSYDKAVNNQFKRWYSDEEWDEMLYQELSAGRPE